MSTTKTETEIVATLQRERDAIQASVAYYAAKLLEAQIAGSQWVKALMAPPATIKPASRTTRAKSSFTTSTVSAKHSKAADMPAPQLLYQTVRRRLPMQVARYKAGKLTPNELAKMRASLQPDFDALCAGQATRKQFAGVSTACELALAIERKGVVKGLRDILIQIEQLLLSLKTYSDKTHGWVPPSLTPEQIEALRELLSLHLWQLQQLSYGEYQAAWKNMLGHISSQGGEIIDGPPIQADR